MSSRNRWVNRLAKRSAVVLAAASAAASFSSSLWASSGTFTYTQGTTSWTNPNAWLFGNIPGVGLPSEDIANFTGVDLAPITPLVLAVTLDTNETVAGMVFSDTNTNSPGGYLLTRSGTSTLTLATNSAAQPFITVNGLGNNPTISLVEISAPLYGTNGFIKNGAGLLRLSGDNTGTGPGTGLQGAITLQGGTLEISNINNLGNTNATIELSRTDSNATTTTDNGRLSLRSDTALNLSSKTILVTGSSQSGGFNVLDVRASTSSLAANVNHSVGTIIIASGNNRQLNITGANLFGLNVGTLVLDPTNTSSVLNNLTPGQLTIGNVVAGAGTTSSSLTLGGTNPASVGSGLTITNSIKQTNAAATLSVTYSDAHTLNVGSFDGVTGNLTISGNGTLNVVGTGGTAGTLPKGILTVSAGTLDFSAAGTAQTVSALVMGTATNNQNAFSYINTGSSTLAVTGNATYQIAGNSAQRLHQGATIDGKVDFGSAMHSIVINGIGTLASGGTAEMLINADVSGSGTLAKSGSGELRLTGNNTLSAAAIISSGTLTGAARASGNALTSGAVTISGGTLRLTNFAGVAGSGSIGALSFDGGATNPALLMVDSGTLTPATTLNIGSLSGRVAGTSGALTIIPFQGGLNTTEIIKVAAVATGVGPAQNHGIFAPYIAAQASGSNTSIDFVSLAGTNVVGGAYSTGDINGVATNGIYSTNTGTVLTGPKQLFAVKADGSLANIGGVGQTLTLGDGTLAGLIVNNGGQVSVANLVINGPEAIFWAGGNNGAGIAGGTVSSAISFNSTLGGLTTSGAETLTIAGSGINLGGQTRNFSINNGTAIVSSTLSNGNLTKVGPGYLILTGGNAGYNGTLLGSSGTLQIGQGALTPNASLASSVVNVGNGNVVLNLDSTGAGSVATLKTVNNFFTSTGTGNLIVNSPTGLLALTNASNNFARLSVLGGTVELTGHNQLPVASTVTVQNAGTLDLNGFNQTLAALAGVADSTGTGAVTNGSAALSNLWFNEGTGVSSTFNGTISNGTGGGGIAIKKIGLGTQILGGNNSYQGGISLQGGTLQLNSNSAAGVGSIQFQGGALALNNGVTTAANVPLQIGNGVGTVGVVGNGNSGTINGNIVVGSGGTLAVTWGGTGQSLNVPDLNAANFTGTVAFSGNGGTFRIVSGNTAGSAFDLSAATFNFGSSTTSFGFNQGSVTVTMPFISGGTNSTIGGGANGRQNNYILGTQGGNQVFAGVIVDGGSPTRLQKEGAGTFSLVSATQKNHTFTGNVVVNNGTFVIGNNALLSGNGALTITNGTLAIAGNGTMSGTKTINVSEQGAFDVTQSTSLNIAFSSAGYTTPVGYALPPTVTLSGTGFVNGAFSHNAGTIAPGGFVRAGTVTFNTLGNPAAFTLGAGVLDLDIAAPGTGVGSLATNVGGGTNDLIVVNGDVAFSPIGKIRVNYIGGGTINANDDFPIIQYTGSALGFNIGSVAGNLSTTSGVVSSAFRSSFSLKDMGGGIIAAHVNAIGGPAQNDIWKGGTSGVWDLNFTPNFNAPLNTGTNFFQQDTVTFDNNGVSRPAVTLTNAIYLPAAVLLDNGSNVVNYTITGNGTISGSTGLLKTNTGTVTLQTRNTFTGNTTIASGVLSQGDFGGQRFGKQVINSPWGVGTVYLGDATGTTTVSVTPTVSVGNTDFVNDIFIPAGRTGNFNFNNGSVSVRGEWHGTGTINITGAGGNSNWYADNRDMTGTVNLIGSGIAIRIGNQNAPGNAFWNFVSPVTMSTILNDPSVKEIPIGGLAGNGNLTGYASGASVTGDKSYVIGGANSDSRWDGRISNSTSGSSGNGITGIVTETGLIKAGTGTLSLTGVNMNYTSDTVVRNGTLQVYNLFQQANGGALTGTKAVRVQTGGTFRLGQIGGDLLTAGTITTASTGLLLTAEGGVIDVQGAYDNGDENVLASAYTTRAGTTWAGNNGTIIGSVQHSAGTISPGRDTGYGAFGTLTFADNADQTSGEVSFFGGAVTMDVGSTTSNADRINAKNLNLSGGTVVVNVIGASAGTNSVYTLMHASGLVNTASGNFALDLRGRGATGTIQTSGQDVQLKIFTPATSDFVTWSGGNGATWDAKGGQNWKNHTGTTDYFYHGDTARFTDTGAGTVNIPYNVTPFGEVQVNNTNTTYTFVGAGKITGAASLHKMGSGTLVIMNDNDFTGGTIIDTGGTLAVGRDNLNDSNGSYQTGNGNANGALFGLNKHGSLGTGAIQNNGALVFRRSDGDVITQNISGSGAVYLTDFGVVELRGTNTYTGGTTVTWGTLKVGHDNAFPTTGSITLVGTTNFTGGNGFNGSGRGGRIDLNGFNQTIDELNAFGSGAAVGDGRPADAYIQNLATLSSNVSVLTINRTGTLGFNSGFHNGAEGNGDPVGQIALVKQSNGVATMNYTSTGTIAVNYSGTTSINGGTLIVRGTHSPAGVGLGTYNVASGAALAGDGFINTRVNILAGGTLAPGVSDGTANFGTMNVASLKMDNANLNFEIAGSKTDNVNVNGNNQWLVSGSNAVNLNILGSANAGTFTLVNYDGATINSLATTLFHIGSVTNPGSLIFTLNSNVQASALELIVTQPIVAATWVTNSGTWGGGGNWTPSTPNAPGSTANFQGISSNATVTLDGPFAVGTMNFSANNAGVGFTLAGTNITTLTLGAPLNNPAPVGITVNSGIHAINVPVVMSNDGVVNVAANAQLSIGGGFGLSANGNAAGHNLTKTGSGTFVAGNIRNTFANNGSALFNVSQGLVRISHKTSANAAEGTSKVNSLAITGGATSKLDLTNNSMVLDYNPPTLLSNGAAIVAQLRGWLNSSDGRLFSSDADATHGIGYKDNLDATGAANRAVANFGGVVVDASSVLLKYTYFGDSNLDGKVEINDLYNLASHYTPSHAAGIGTQVWQSGDFNYDGWVDLKDLTLLTTNWQQDIAVGGAGTGSPLGPILASLGLPQVAVPEPTTLGLMGLGLTGLMARRRRRA